MKNFTIISTLFLVFFLTASVADTRKDTHFSAQASFEELKNVLTQQYAYIDRPGVDVEALFSKFQDEAISSKTKQAFLDIAQKLLRHFYDPHLNLGPYNESDFSVFPTGSDIRVVYIDGKFIIEDVKSKAAADNAGIKPGAEVMSIDGTPIEQAIEMLFGNKVSELSLNQVNYGANVVLGGLRNQHRAIEIKTLNQLKTYDLPPSYKSINDMRDGPTLYYSISNGIGLIKFNNSLGNSKTAAEFKKALSAMSDTTALIIDLRNTPSGGNTSTAEPIMGHFVDKKTTYQLYQQQAAGVRYQDAEMKKAYVEPSSPYYAKPFLVLAGHWTGSMGEGMTIGLDALGAKTIIGAPMADLLGGIKTVTLTNSNAWLELGFERLYHVNGSFREDFEPRILLKTADRDRLGNDPALSKAYEFFDEFIGDNPKANQH